MDISTKNIDIFPLHLLPGLTNFPNKIAVINSNCHTRYDRIVFLFVLACRVPRLSKKPHLKPVEIPALISVALGSSAYTPLDKN